MKTEFNPAYNRRWYRSFSGFLVALLVIFMVMAVAGCGGGAEPDTHYKDSGDSGAIKDNTQLSVGIGDKEVSVGVNVEVRDKPYKGTPVDIDGDGNPEGYFLTPGVKVRDGNIVEVQRQARAEYGYNGELTPLDVVLWDMEAFNEYDAEGRYNLRTEAGKRNMPLTQLEESLNVWNEKGVYIDTFKITDIKENGNVEVEQIFKSTKKSTVASLKAEYILDKENDELKISTIRGLSDWIIIKE